jgi:hypothetical protein
VVLGFGAANTGDHLERIDVPMEELIDDVGIDDQPVFRAFESNTDMNTAIGIEGLDHPRKAPAGT